MNNHYDLVAILSAVAFVIAMWFLAAFVTGGMNV